ncbi:hypothetical protein [Nocardioides taihuensis]|uniref:Uncharacterized protein n=1 Tax=Nocardioides taihuensis TaxID=1835606 RepID=A0ABW0BL14_9ACTN
MLTQLWIHAFALQAVEGRPLRLDHADDAEVAVILLLEVLEDAERAIARSMSDQHIPL